MSIAFTVLTLARHSVKPTELHHVFTGCGSRMIIYAAVSNDKATDVQNIFFALTNSFITLTL